MSHLKIDLILRSILRWWDLIGFVVDGLNCSLPKLFHCHNSFVDFLIDSGFCSKVVEFQVKADQSLVG